MADADETEWEDVEWEDVGSPTQTPSESQSAWQKIIDSVKGVNAKVNREANAAAVGALTAIPKAAGVRQDLGQFGAGLVDKFFGSDKPLGELVQRSAPQISEFYKTKKEEEPFMTGLGEGLGMSVVAPASAGAGAAAAAMKASPFVANLIGTGGVGLDAALQSGLLGYANSEATGSEGKTDDAISQAILGGLLGTGAAFAPGIASADTLRSLKQAPGKGWDALKVALGGGGKTSQAATQATTRADDFATQMASVPDNVVQMPQRPPASPSGGYNVEDTGAMKALPPELDAAGKGDLTGPRNKDPEFLRKSQELADMLADGGDTAVSPIPPHGIRGPNIKHKGEYRGQQLKYPRDDARIPNSEGLDVTLDPEARQVWQDRTAPSNSLDDMFFSDPSAAEERVWEFLDEGPMGVSRNRQAWDVDSVVGQPQAAAPAEESTKNAIAGKKAAELQGDQFTDHTRRMDFDELKNTLKGHGYDDAGNPFYTPDQIEKFMNEVNAQGAAKLRRQPIDVGDDFAAQLESEMAGQQRNRLPIGNRKPIEVPADKAANAAQAQTPWDDEAIAAARKSGSAKLESLGGKVGGVLGAASSIGGGLGGIAQGYKAGQKLGVGAARYADKVLSAISGATPEKMASKLIREPGRLVELEQQGGELGRAAAFVLAGAREGGEQGLQARAYVLAAMPQFREWFAENVGD